MDYQPRQTELWKKVRAKARQEHLDEAMVQSVKS